MARILVAYGTSGGHTALVAEVVAGVIRAHGHTVDVVDVHKSPHVSVEGYDGAIVGSAVHLAQHDPSVVQFARSNRRMLDRMSAAFFSVSLPREGDGCDARRHLERFELETGWWPTSIAVFGGALFQPHYRSAAHHMVQQVGTGRAGKPGTAASQRYAYGGWDSVRRFAENFVGGLPLPLTSVAASGLH